MLALIALGSRFIKALFSAGILIQNTFFQLLKRILNADCPRPYEYEKHR
jgi:hypothetical protein